MSAWAASEAHLPQTKSGKGKGKGQSAPEREDEATIERRREAMRVKCVAHYNSRPQVVIHGGGPAPEILNLRVGAGGETVP